MKESKFNPSIKRGFHFKRLSKNYIEHPIEFVLTDGLLVIGMLQVDTAVEGEKGSLTYSDILIPVKEGARMLGYCATVQSADDTMKITVGRTNGVEWNGSNQFMDWMVLDRAQMHQLGRAICLGLYAIMEVQ